MILKLLILSGLNSFWGYLLLKLIYLGLASLVLLIFPRLISNSSKPWKYQIIFRYCNILLLIGLVILELQYPLWVWLQLGMELAAAFLIGDLLNLISLAGFMLFFLYQSFLVAKRSGVIIKGFGSYLAQHGYIWLFIVNLILFLRFDYFYLPMIVRNPTWYQLTLIELGVLAIFLILQLGVLQIRKLKMSEASPELLALVDEVAGRFKIKVRVVRIWHLDGIKNAFTTGIFMQSIFLTRLLAETASPADLKMILGHECAHLKQRHLIIRVAVILFFIGFGSMLVEGYFELSWFVYTIYAILAFGIYKGISRFQEFQADGMAAKLLGGGQLMADALDRVFGGSSRRFGWIMKWFIGHPDLKARIDRLIRLRLH